MDSVEKIKEKLSIVEVVGSYVKLTKAGKYYRGLSPFNKEKTPSFYVNVERGTYYCFSSGQGGDQFTFIEKMEGVDFKGALKLLAEKAGVELAEYRSEDKGKLERLREAMARSELFFTESMGEGGDAFAYAQKRGLTKETITSWGLGLAPDGWRGLLEALSAKGFTTDELIKAGLIKEAEGKRGTYYDRFRNRLMFPIKDPAGRTVAFTGRALGDDEAKYLNSPETELYKKSEILFGMDKAKDAIRTRGFAILVEGQFDLVLLHQIGFQNTIALSGTALSDKHLSLIKRYAENLLLCLDADRAGLAASFKNAHAALSAGMKVKAVTLPEGKDPADIASEDPAAFKKLVAESKPVVEFFLSVLAASEPDQHKLVLKAEKVVLPLVSAMQSSMEREHFIGVVARALSLSPEAVREAMPRPGAQESTPLQAAPKPESGAGEPVNALEERLRLLLAVMANYPDTPLEKRVRNEYARIIGTSAPDFDVPERSLFEAGLFFGETPSENAADDLIRSYEQAFLSQKLEEATMRLRQAEGRNDESAITEAMTECKELSEKIRAL